MFFGEKERITDFGYVKLRISGMRLTSLLETENLGDSVQVSEYHQYCVQNGTEWRLVRRASCSADEAVRILNECGVCSWDGFHGKHPAGVRDGEMFSFEAVVNGDRVIKAEGSENFPKNFRELRNWFYEMLKDHEV